MSWHETHRYYDALRAAVADVEQTADGTLPWCDEFAEVFGDPIGLLLALRRHWTLIVQAQVEQPSDLEPLVRRHRGLLAVLRHHDEEPRVTAPARGVA
jgi:hypothetical protein